jgi:DNA mismatch repair protein MutL
LLNVRPGTLRQRITDVFGKKISQDLLPIQVETTLCNISGFVGKPESARKKGVHNFFFVNGRYMKHAYFHKAVTNAFERLVPEGMQVPYFIYFDVNPADIDVNIHPTKTEIKFENEQSIWQILTAAVKDAIGRFCEIPAIDFDTEGRPDIPVFDPERDSINMPRVSYNPDYNPFKSSHDPENVQHSHSTPTNWQQLYDAALSRRQPISPALFTPDEQPDDGQPADMIAEKSPSHYQYKGRYIMTAVKSGLMVIDQQRADTRIRYERYLRLLHQQAGTTQRMLFPEVVEFSPADAVIAAKLLPKLQALGFDLTSLGAGSYAIAGTPAELDGLDPVNLLRSLIGDASGHDTGNGEQLHASLAQSMARHAAIPQGQVLNNDEMERLINELFACENVNYTPDGHPILCIIPHDDIEQHFR